MKGTSSSHTRAMTFSPPMTTTPVISAWTMPVTWTLTPNCDAASVEIELACTMLPMPNEANTVKSANSTASHFMPRPRSSAYIGPPSIVPSAVLTRYFTASSASLYFVAMPRTPVSHIHSTAPGPPRLTAVATPTMLPVPIVAASAVVRAANGLTSPSAPFSAVTDRRMAVSRCRCMNAVRMVRKMWVPKSRMRSGGPQTNASAALIQPCRVSIMLRENAPSAPKREAPGEPAAG